MNGKCVDIDECAENTYDCPRNQFCVNTEIGYECVSPTTRDQNSTMNHTGNIQNVCEQNNDLCKENEECINTPGSYKCVLRCDFGMREENGKCVDIDECNEKTHNCTANQICVNKQFGYDCKEEITTVDIFQCFIDGIESVETANSTCNKKLFPLSNECQSAFRKGCEYERNVKQCQFGIDNAMSGKLEFIVKRHCQANQEQNVSSYNVKSQCCRKMELK
ncbi:hypothetical protein B4U80_10863 [Leptotrombidium deliense]|uniref:EGF-like calcium-binding domain-containing protein n=1 Tax=Leptotrombidium deliense TaxID=299467 RepID=A0A443RVX1_9ACAR|nr:hypothetical protein B4U80_10863 [Leptotrombidium deliense]